MIPEDPIGAHRGGGPQLRRTAVYEYHKEFGRLTEFAGFEMPLWYSGIVSECLAVRSGVGIFDVSHMGRILIKGRDAEAFLDRVSTNDVQSLKPSKAHYSLLCNPNGGIKDDIVLFKLDEGSFMMIVNAANRGKDFSWLVENSRGFDVSLSDISEAVALFAVQGPKARDALQRISQGADLRGIPRFCFVKAEIGGLGCLISVTGYTGEDGLEVFVPSANRGPSALGIWRAILEAGSEFRIKPCGLGARDVLRLEAGLCLYGNDIDEHTNPLEAGLAFAVKMGKGDFIGRDALEAVSREGPKRERVGIVLEEEGIPRRGFEISKGGERIGEVTSGTYSPILKRGIAMGYIGAGSAAAGDAVEISIRGRRAKGFISRFPLVKCYWGSEAAKEEERGRRASFVYKGVAFP
ncbi:MAG: glycine cleavage system aminomethyltransferase GcvT [Candidatus Bathyarchaeia archaeon]